MRLVCFTPLKIKTLLLLLLYELIDKNENFCISTV